VAIQEREADLRPFPITISVTARQVEEVLGFVAHEIRSPLSILHGAVMLSTGERRLSAEDLAALRQDAIAATARLTRLADSLLWLTRLESGQAFEREPVSLPHVLKEAATLSEHAHKRASITLDLPHTLPLVAGQPSLVADVAHNLIDNACKYSGAHARVELAAEACELGVLVCVRDHGPGVAPEELDAIFEAFYRAPSADGVKGIGLGLRFCKLAVEAHGGSIWAELPEDGGLRVCFTLPALPEA
jgi:signal transduction histidine kinase